jgi:hypothetical protein
MKKIFLKLQNRAGRMLMLISTISIITGSSVFAFGKTKQNGDTANFVTLTGKVLDKETRKPVLFANVYLVGTSIGTVANSEGEFMLKVPKSKTGAQIGFTHIGYKNYNSDVDKMRNSETIIELVPELISLKEVIIRSDDPIALLKGALENVPKNYSTVPVMETGFYREAIKQNRKYVSIAEGVLNAYKAPYDNQFANDRVKIVIGRIGQDVKRMDTIVVKLQGGPITPFFLDIVKNPENILTDDYFKYYDYSLAGQVSLDNTRCYVINFNQKKDVELPLYKGKIYIEVDNLAIAGIEFGLSEYGLPQASSMFIKKKPLTMKAEVTGADYYVRYAKWNGKWNLSYVRSEMRFKCKWKKKLFSSNYTTMVEMAVTNIDTANISKFKSSETTKMTDIFTDKAYAFKNDDFWGDYNIIKPDESIQNAIDKLSKKMKK